MASQLDRGMALPAARQGSPLAVRLLALLIALPCLAAGLFAATQYPLSPPLATATYVVWAALCLWRPQALFTVTLALLPIAGFASWTGWLVVEELDLALAGAAGAGYLRILADGLAGGAAAGRQARPEAPAADSLRGTARIQPGPLALLLMLTFGVSCLVAAARGFAAAEATPLQWAQGYFESLNGLRLFKPFAWLLILTPILADRYKRDPDAFANGLVQGMTAGLAACALAAIWERAAYPGLLNFSADYRSTALFWEMHVGGAALDGYLALGMPFAVWATWRAKTPLALVLPGLATMAGAYACLTTFSRGVYLAVPVSLILMAWLANRSYARQGPVVTFAAVLRNSLAMLAVAVGAWLVFAQGGYRAMAAAFCVLAAVMLTGPAGRSLGAARTGLGLLAGLVGGMADLALSGLPKGPYLIHTAAAGAFAAAAIAHALTARALTRYAMFAATGWMLVTTARIALHWGGESALTAALPVLAVLAMVALANAGLRGALWAADRRLLAMQLGGAAMVTVVVAVMSGGAYMGDRFASVSRDFEGRMDHWSDSLGMLVTPSDWLIGKGMGQFPANYFYHLKKSDLPGSYAWKQTDGNGYLTMTGPRYPMSWGDLFRISQRVPAQRGPYVVSADVRSRPDVRLHIEVCEKNLLYGQACAVEEIETKGSPTEWRPLTLVLDGKDLSGGAWYAPRLAMFSVAVSSNGAKVELDNFRVQGPDGRQLMTNPGFDHGNSGWFFTSDRHHLPWHIKNLGMNVLFDQGLTGLLVFSALVLAALGRLVFGSARHHPLASCVSAAIVGFVTVGLFDSLLDVPRVAWVFYLLLLVAFLLRPVRKAAQPARPPAEPIPQ
ncbi:MAG: hypothetical protein IPM01_25345 [Burkholderiaceae bacterium]|nr:hypothetical protein [Burkholderiaceae bacterium]